jgi:hypothetical protein
VPTSWRKNRRRRSLNCEGKLVNTLFLGEPFLLSIPSLSLFISFVEGLTVIHFQSTLAVAHHSPRPLSAGLPQYRSSSAPSRGERPSHCLLRPHPVLLGTLPFCFGSSLEDSCTMTTSSCFSSRRRRRLSSRSTPRLHVCHLPDCRFGAASVPRCRVREGPGRLLIRCDRFATSILRRP